MLLGHTFTERPNVRIIKTPNELKFENVDLSNDLKLLLKAEDNIVIMQGEMKVIKVSSDQKLNGSVYVGGSVRGCVGREYYLLPGEYKIRLGTCSLLIQNLGVGRLNIPKGKLVTRATYLNKVKRVQNVMLTDNRDEQIDNTAINCGSNLSENEKSKLNKLLEMFATYFSSGYKDVGYTTEAEMVIHLKDSEPVVYRPYRMSRSERHLVQSMVNEMMDCGIVRKSTSQYASPIVLVNKNRAISDFA